MPVRRHSEHHGKHRAPRAAAAPFRCHLVVMAKAPAAGGVKTRLTRDIGVAQATRFARQCAAAVLARVAHDRRWCTILAVTPDRAVGDRWWPCALHRTPQGGGD